MPHAHITRTNDVRAEAEPMATNLVRFCAVHTEFGVNSEKDRTPRPQRANPLPIRPAVSREHRPCLTYGHAATGSPSWGWPVMRPGQYSRWVDPAPLEVERPRLPWWTMLPRKLLLAASPIILLAVVTTVVAFVVRRVWRYPLFLISTAILISLDLSYSWWAPVTLLAALAVLGGVWTWQHPDSFTRTVLRQVRSEWRRAVIYAWPWRRVMLFTELTKHTGHAQRRVHYPRLVRREALDFRMEVKDLRRWVVTAVR
jgi:hypothetical protein